MLPTRALPFALLSFPGLWTRSACLQPGGCCSKFLSTRRVSNKNTSFIQKLSVKCPWVWIPKHVRPESVRLQNLLHLAQHNVDSSCIPVLSDSVAEL